MEDPKYKKHMMVITKSGKTVGIDKVYWSKYNNCWMYEISYGLGGTSIGYIRECEIRKQKIPTIFLT